MNQTQEAVSKVWTAAYAVAFVSQLQIWVSDIGSPFFRDFAKTLESHGRTIGQAAVTIADAAVANLPLGKIR